MTLKEDEDVATYVPSALAKAWYGVQDSVRRKLPPLPGRNYMKTVNWIDEINEGKLVPEGAIDNRQRQENMLMLSGLSAVRYTYSCLLLCVQKPLHAGQCFDT